MYAGKYGYAGRPGMTIRTFTMFLGISVLCCLWLAPGQATAAACDGESGVVLQVLGSGGPIADDARASTGYLIWVDGRSRVLIDTGGGTFLRFGEAGAKFEDLDFIGLSHLHTDHSADFPALIKSGNFSPRQRALPMAGPSGDGAFPGLTSYLQSMFGEGGAYAYLGAFLNGTGGKPMLVPREIEPGEPVVAFVGDSLRVDALRVPHAIVPTVAFRVSVGDVSLVFASDQNGGDPAFAEFAKDATVLVMHMVVPEGVTGVGRRLHAPPSVIGDIAAEAAPGKLVLSHFMARSLATLDDNVALVRERYDGKVVLADDLACIAASR
jgi:ribonuclease BN (tRNA processing enzyme)